MNFSSADRTDERRSKYGTRDPIILSAFFCEGSLRSLCALCGEGLYPCESV